MVCTMTLEMVAPATLSTLQAESFALVSEVTWIINLISTDGPNVVLRILQPMLILSILGVWKNVSFTSTSSGQKM